MEISTVVKCDESEIVALIDEHFGCDYESIVAMEEIGNHVWVAKITSDYDADVVVEFIEYNKTKYATRDLMGRLCADGIIPAGEYMVDCTW